MRVVLDTNILVSGLLAPNGPPAVILNLTLNDRLQVLYDSRILQEYIEVLHREKFGFNAESVAILIDYLEKEGICVTAMPTSKHIKDDDDRVFYEVFSSGESDYLITGNKSHFPNEERIVTPRDFVEEYRRRHEDSAV